MMNPNPIRGSGLNTTNFTSEQMYRSKNHPYQPNFSREVIPEHMTTSFESKKK